MKRAFYLILVVGAMSVTIPVKRHSALPLLFPGERPVVRLDYADYRGKTNYQYDTQDFLGMKFAKANRLEEAQLIPASEKGQETIEADQYGDACPQVLLNVSIGSDVNEEAATALTAALTILSPPPGVFPGQSEDCLSVNVQVPKGVKKGDKLPVMMWIHGGGFQLGSSMVLGSELTDKPSLFNQGATLVKRSVEMNKPIIFVSANHRLNFFGALAGEEINKAGASNLYLKDQRLVMKWIKKYIAEFGGNPDHVVAVGESAGAQSIACHFAINPGETEELIKGAWMFSGGPFRVSPASRAQPVYNDFVQQLGCTNEADTLACLKKVDFQNVFRVVQQLSPSFLGYRSMEGPWWLRPDGELLKHSPHVLWKNNEIAKIPMVIGGMKDEGTLFSQSNQLNISNTKDFKSYFRNNFWKDSSTDEQMDRLAHLYPNDPTRGSPFDTGLLNSPTPQYKRIAALLGDAAFESQRRLANEFTSHTHKQWSFQIELDLPLLLQTPVVKGVLETLKLTNVPQLGSFHVGDAILHLFGTVPPKLSQNSLHIMSCVVSFVHDLDPNNHGLDLPFWPMYKWGQPAIGQEQIFHFTESKVDLIPDDYRREAIQYINDATESFLF